MRFGLLFKPLVLLFTISERNITLVSREFPRIIIIKVKFVMKGKVRHKVICLQLNAARNTNNYFFTNPKRSES